MSWPQFWLADAAEEVDLGLEEVDVALLVGHQLLEEVLRDVVPDLLAVVAGFLVEVARVVLAGEVAVEGLARALADAQRVEGLEVRVAFEEDDPVHQLVGVVHLLDALGARLVGEMAVAPVLLEAIVQPVLADRRQLAAQRLVEILDDPCIALHRPAFPMRRGLGARSRAKLGDRVPGRNMESF